MGKTLVIAEKPSVGRDLSRVLPGAFPKHEGYLESDDHVMTWAVGHLVQLAEPDEYDPKYKKWRMADLPIVPDRFKLVVRDERSRKQMTRDHAGCSSATTSTEVVNACDAGREGELIFAWTFEKAGAKKPVAAAVAVVDDHGGDQAGVRRPAPARRVRAARGGGAVALGGRLDRRHERDAAATIRLRSSFDGAVSLGRVQTPTLAIIARREEEIRAFKPEPYWLVDARFEPTGGEPGRTLRRPLPRRRAAAAEDRRGGRGDRRRRPRPGRATITKLEKTTKKERAPLLYDLTSLQREANTRFGFSARRTLAAAQRLYEEHKALTYPRTNSRFLTGDMVGEIKPTAALVGQATRVRARPPRT